VDLKLAAPVLGLAPADVRLKVNYPVPEIWVAGPEASAGTAASRLRDAGFRVAVVPGVALGAIPPRNPILSFSFEDQGLLLRAGEQARVEYDATVIAVLFTPRPGESRETAVPAFLELFAVVRGRLQRWTFLQGTTGFGGMGTRQSASFGMNVHAFAADLERRFAKCTVDERLVNMQVRRRLGTPPTGMARRGYSYATASLNDLLESLSPGLSDIEHDDLASRLAFLTQAAG
jgi:hypothetical protein